MTQAKVYVGNLPYRTSTQELHELFGECGEIADIKLITDRNTGASKGFGFITFEDLNAVEEALKKDSTSLGGRQIRVRPAREDNDRPQTNGNTNSNGNSHYG